MQDLTPDLTPVLTAMPDADPEAKAAAASWPDRSRGAGMKHLLRAAEKGDPGAQFNLGILFANRIDGNGQIISGNRADAIKWLLLAAEQDFPRAQMKLGEIYAEGADTPENSIKACAWFLRAMTNSSGMHRQNAQTGFNRVSSQMDEAQVAEARQLAEVSKREVLKQTRRDKRAAAGSPAALGAGAR